MIRIFIEYLSGDHIEHSTGGTDNDLLRLGLESLDFDFHVVATNTSVTGGAHVVTKGENDLKLSSMIPYLY